MTWAEFNLRLFSYNRQCEREDKNFREVAFSALWSFNIDPKSLPKTRESFWSIGTDKIVSDTKRQKMIALMLEAQEQYKKDKNGRV